MLDSTSGVRKTDLAVIILQKNEKLHIRRCLERLVPLAPRQVFVVDCFSTDGSDKIASEMGATIVSKASLQMIISILWIGGAISIAVMPAGCGTSGKNSGTGVWSIRRLAG